MNNFKLYETDHHIIYLNEEAQLYIGRSVVVLKSPKASLSDMSDLEWQDFGKVTKVYENALKSCFNATYFNWGCFLNNAFKEQNPQPQVHWQVRPRYKNPVEFNGKTFKDEALVLYNTR